MRKVGVGGDNRPIAEKPAQPKSNRAATGLYCCDNKVVDNAAGLTRLARGELEIVDGNNRHIDHGALKGIALGRGRAWMGVGTHEPLLQAGHFIAASESRQNIRNACVEEVAWRMGVTEMEQFAALAVPLVASGSGRCLIPLIDEAG